MKPLTLQETIEAMAGTMDRPVPVGSINRVVIDSREVMPGDLFLAIRGDRFDGHDFVGQAFAAGAVAAVVRSDFTISFAAAKSVANTSPSSSPMLIRVDDPVEALGRLARYYRCSVIDGSVTVLAVTGSNGKTTTKSMIAHVLGKRWKGRASIKSFNNEIGVPLTLLSTEPSDEFVVCEVGTNAPGEIAALARLIEPEIAVITGVGPVHLEGLGSLEGVVAEKLSLLDSLRPEGCAIINVDHEVLRWSLEHRREFANCKKVTFGTWSEADLRLTSIETDATDAAMAGAVNSSQQFTVNDRFFYRLNVPGRHNALNAMAAIGVARRFGMNDDQIAERLASFELPPMRLNCQRVGSVTLINDAYNANPTSVKAAVNVLEQTQTEGRRVLIVGDMRELGESAGQWHEHVAERIGSSCIDLVIAVGEHAKLIRQVVKRTSGHRISVHAYGSTALAKRRIASLMQPGDTVLVKGSRLLALERLVEVIVRWATKDKKVATTSPVKKRSECRATA